MVGTAAGAATGELGAVRQEARGTRQELRAVRDETAVTEAGLTSVLEKLEGVEQRIETPPPLPPAEGRNRLGLAVEAGVVVADVVPGSPAAAAGLRRGDVMTAVNGEALHTAELLRQKVVQLPPHAEVKLRVARESEDWEVQARLDE